MGIPAEIIQIMDVLGVKGVRKVRCKVVDGPDKDKVITRNVAGPIQLGDIIVLKETAMDSEGRWG